MRDMEMRFVAAASLALAAAAVVSPYRVKARAQEQTGSVSGSVVDARSGRPVADVIVKLSAAGGLSTDGRTDASGTFTFSNLAPGAVGLTASGSTYLEAAYGRLWPGGPSTLLRVDRGEHVEGIHLRIWPASTIAGTVAGLKGAALVGLRVQAFRQASIGGQARWVVTGQGSADDRGMYRIGGLPPGRYKVGILTSYITVPGSLVGRMPRETMISGGAVLFTHPLSRADGIMAEGFLVCSLRGSPPPIADGDGILVYPATYYPNSAAADLAADLVLAAGDDREGVDFSLVPSRGARMSGTVRAGAGPPPPMSLQLLPRQGDDQGTPIAAAITDVIGRFAFLGVPSGTYWLRGERQGSPVIRAEDATPDIDWVATEVTVGEGGVNDLFVPAGAGQRLRGQVAFDETASAQPNLARTRVSVEPEVGPRIAAGLSGARIGADGRFVTPPVPAGRYFIRVSGLPPGWAVKSITVGSLDYTERPLALDDATGAVTIHVASGIGSLAGVVQGPMGQLIDGGVVLVFPADRAAWSGFGRESPRFRAVAFGRDGSYVVPGLPGGEYLAVALSAGVDSGWMATDVLTRIRAKASALTVGSSRAMLTLHLTTGLP